MRRSTVIWLLMLFGTFMLCAQTPLEKMNSIKMSNEYIWDEYTHISPDTATIGAVRRLLLYIDVPEDRILAEDDIMGSVKFIKMKRSTLTRVFAYISKKNAQALVNGELTIATSEPVAEIVTAGEDSIAVISIDSVIADPLPAFQPLPLAQELMAKSDFYAGFKYIQQLRDDGFVTGYGSLKDSDDIDNRYLAIYQKQTNRPVCVLSPVYSGDSRTNLVDGSADSLANYEDGNHIAIWFNIKQ